MELQNLQRGYRELREKLDKLERSPVVNVQNRPTGQPNITIHNHIPSKENNAEIDLILTDILEILDMLVRSKVKVVYVSKYRFNPLYSWIIGIVLIIIVILLW